jgi:hypothetical protein
VFGLILLEVNFSLLEVDFRVFHGFILEDLVDEEKVEDAANVLAPVHEKLVENLIEDVVVDGLLEIVGKDVVELVDQGQHLLEEEGVVGLQDALDADVEVVVVEVVRQLLVVVADDLEVALDEVQTLHDRTQLVQTRLGEDLHHEGVQQLLVFYQLHVALRHLLAELQDPTAVHFPDEHREEFAVVGEVLPHYAPAVVQEDEGLVPQLGEEAVEELFVLAVEKESCPFWVLGFGLL